MKRMLHARPDSRSLQRVTPDQVVTLARAAGNLPDVETIQPTYLNVRDVLKYDRLVVIREAIAVIEGLWALPAERRIPSRFKAARLAARAALTAPAAVAVAGGEV